jgi:hypothetical protein
MIERSNGCKWGTTFKEAEVPDTTLLPCQQQQVDLSGAEGLKFIKHCLPKTQKVWDRMCFR